MFKIKLIKILVSLFNLFSLFLIFSISNLYAYANVDVNANTFANEYIKKDKLTPISIYKQTYFIFGDKEDQVKAQVSFKYSIFKNYSLGIFLGYTTIMNWNLYESSAPFYDISYMPELFLKSKTLIPYLDYIQFSPIEHKSNGKDGDDSRSLNRTYIQIQYSNKIMNSTNLGLNLKLMYFYNSEKTSGCFDTNKNFNKYTNNYEAKLFFNIYDYKLYIKSSGFRYGWREIGFLSKKISSTNIRFYAQYRTGYFDNMLSYYKKNNAVRLGVSLN